MLRLAFFQAQFFKKKTHWTPRYAYGATARGQRGTKTLSGRGANACANELEDEYKEMWRSEDEEPADAWWQTTYGSGWWTTRESGTEECWSKSPKGGRERFYVREAKEEKTRRWQRPREEGARVQVLSSFAKPDKTNEQTEVRIVVPAEVPRDVTISIDDLADADESDIEIDQSKDNEKKVKQPGPKNP